MNHIVNIRDQPGEIMITIIAEKYPEKINADKMQDIIAAKSQHNEMRIYDVKKLIIPIKDES